MRNKYRGADIRARLSHTVLRYDGKPYYCETDGELLRLYTFEPRSLHATIEPDDEKLDISSLTLGYFNIRGTAVYLSRQTYRRYKQGVELQTLNIRTHGRTSVNSDHLLCTGFQDGLMGKYPSFTEGMKLITSGKNEAVAFNKDVAVLREKDLFKFFVKGEEAGWMRPGTKEVNVPSSETSWVNVFLLEQVSGITIKEL